MNNKQLLIGGIVFLFALNLFTIGFMLWDKKHHHNKHYPSHFHSKKSCNMQSAKGHHCASGSGCSSFHPKGKKHHKDGMAKILNLSEEQNAIIKEERKEHFSTIKKLKAEKRGIKKDLFALLKKDEIDSVKMNTLLDEIATNERREKEELIRYFIIIKDNLSDEQLTKFEEMIEKMNRHFHKRDSLK